jgi:3-deoxy-D-manno-octulosonate 8-phosphate phosphatase KdsC-like HAD superfamily phosphatase
MGGQGAVREVCDLFVRVRGPLRFQPAQSAHDALH